MADSTLREACSFVEHRKLSKASPLVLAETHREVSFDIVLLSLDGGYSIPLHDHPMRTGISVCVSGEVIVSNYDLQASSGAISLLLRSRRTIRAGEASTLTETVGNIHTITATQHTQLIDIFSPAGPNNGRFHRYKVASDSKGGTTLKVTSID
jgi:hypothetical protein